MRTAKLYYCERYIERLSLFALVAVAVGVLFVIIGFSGTSAPDISANAQAGPIVLPLEVLGPDGFTVLSEVNVADASGITHLYVQAHNLSYEGKGSVRINGGTWVELNAGTVTCLSPEVALGCIGGVYPTIRFTIPVRGVLSGKNSIEFRHNYRFGDVSSGWRVLDFNFLRSSGEEVLAQTEFSHDEPATWTAPLRAASDITDGASLWSAQGTLMSPHLQKIVASCADCHTADGSDLKYFNFSNRSIIVRSEFHGLSEEEGRKIASYIRSLELEAEDGTAYEPIGTPWDPPYQPGPGMDAQPPHLWAAGAGLEWVLDSDREMLPFMFPSGVRNSEETTKSTLNLREIPVDLQFPDWNGWLPSIHPLDAWGSTFTSHAVSQRYEELQDAVASGNPALVDRAITRLNVETRNLRNTRPPGMSDQEYASARLSLQQWQLVKVWEAQRNFEDKAPSLFVHGETRSWLGNVRNIFDLGPHIINVNGVDNEPFQYGSQFKDHFMTHVWYQVQMILNAGNRKGTGQNPMDWNYQFQFLRKDPRPSAMRHVQSIVKGWQMRDNQHGINTASGWRIFDTRPSHIGRMFAAYLDYPTIYSDVDPATRKDLAELLLRMWLEKQLSYPINEWPRGYGTDLYEPADYLPKVPKDPFFRERDHADNIYSLAAILGNEGVDPMLLGRLVAWGKQMWPLGDWDRLIETDPDTSTSVPSIAEHKIDLRKGWNLVSTYVEPDDPRMDVVLADALDQVVMVKDIEGNVYSPGFSDTIGGWNVHTAYRIYTRESTSFTVRGRSLVQDASAIPLTEGWNLLPYPRSEPLPVQDAVASIKSSMVILVDEFGRTFYPELEIDEIGHLQPGRGYRAYLEHGTSLVYPITDAPTSASKAGQASASGGEESQDGVDAFSLLVVDAPHLDDETHVSAWTPEEYLVGAAEIRDGRAILAVRGEDNPPLTTVVAPRDGDELILRMRLKSDDAPQALSYQGSENALTGEADEGALRHESGGVFVVKVTEMPLTFGLDQNYPNPFNPSTSIGFTLPRDSHVTLEVFDVVGRRVAMILNEMQQAGTHNLTFDAGGLASGTYFYRLTADRHMSIRKMLLAR